MGTGAFAAGGLNMDLNLVLKQGSPYTGNVVPAQSVHRDQFQAHLAATRPEWSPDET
jgi:hypothetical protein